MKSKEEYWHIAPQFAEDKLSSIADDIRRVELTQRKQEEHLKRLLARQGELETLNQILSIINKT